MSKEVTIGNKNFDVSISCGRSSRMYFDLKDNIG